MLKQTEQKTEEKIIYDAFLESQKENERLELELEKIRIRVKKKRQENDLLNDEIEMLKKANRQLEKKVAREQIEHSEQLELKQQEIAILSEKMQQPEKKLIKKTVAPNLVSETEAELYQEIESLSKQLEEAEERLEQQEIGEGGHETGLSKKEIGEILFSAKLKAREIVAEATAYANRTRDEVKHVEEQLEVLKNVKAEYNDFFNLMKILKEGTERTFSEMTAIMEKSSYDHDEEKAEDFIQ